MVWSLLAARFCLHVSVDYAAFGRNATNGGSKSVTNNNVHDSRYVSCKVQDELAPDLS